MKNEIVKKLEEKFEEIIEIMELKKRLGHDFTQHISDTPKRISKMFVNELFSGVYEEFPKISIFENKTNISTPVTLTNIKINSVCAHHFIPFEGYCSIEYSPNKKIIGISKLSRIINYYSKRPQIQEELTKQIGDKIKELLDPYHICVVIKAKHLCITHRGVNETFSEMITSYFESKYDKTQANIIIQKLLNSMIK